MSRSLGGEVRDVALADADGARVDVLEAGEHAQRGGLAAAGGTDEDEELAVLMSRLSVSTAGIVAPA